MAHASCGEDGFGGGNKRLLFFARARGDGHRSTRRTGRTRATASRILRGGSVRAYDRVMAMPPAVLAEQHRRAAAIIWMVPMDVAATPLTHRDGIYDRYLELPMRL